MKRVRESTSILHTLNNENKAHSWKSLEVAAKLELERIEVRAAQLRQAIETFSRSDRDGVPIIAPNENISELVKKASLQSQSSATQN